MRRNLLDASALLALLHDEAGGDTVAALLPDAAMSTINWSEVIQKAHAHGVPTGGLREDLESVGVDLLPFETDDAEEAARLWRDGARHLSLADRACLATARNRRMIAVTADRDWLELDLDLEVRSIR